MRARREHLDARAPGGAAGGGVDGGGVIARTCAICGASSCHGADFATLAVSSWWDGERQREARSVVVCTDCLGGRLLPSGCARVVALGVSALLGGGL